MDREVHMSKQLSISTSTQSFNTAQPTTRREQPSTTTNPLMASNSGPTSASTRRGQSSATIRGRSGSSVVPPVLEEQDTSTQPARYGSISKARGANFPSVDPAGIYA